MIGEDTIMANLDVLLTSSQPGASVHHLLAVSAPLGPADRFGMPVVGRPYTSMYVIGPDAGVDVQAFIAQQVAGAGVDASRRGERVVFAGLAQQVWAVPEPDGRARELLRQGRLFEHPRVAEKTVLYAACRDGRRWRAQRWLTGPYAGVAQDAELLVGSPRRGEGYGFEGLIMRLAGVVVPW